MEAGDQLNMYCTWTKTRNYDEKLQQKMKSLSNSLDNPLSQSAGVGAQ